MGLAAGEDVERCREGLQAETPPGPSFGLLWEDKATKAVLDFLKSTRVGCLRCPPKEEGAADNEGEEGGPGRP